MMQQSQVSIRINDNKRSLKLYNMRFFFISLFYLIPFLSHGHGLFYATTQSLDEHDYLDDCDSQIDNKWIFSERLYNKHPALKESLESIQHEDGSFKITFSSQRFFQYCFQDGIKISTSVQPRFVVIAINLNDEIYETEDVLHLWQSIAGSSALDMMLPLWDLEDLAVFNSTELRGFLSSNYQQLMRRYEADYLIILRGSSNDDLWDFRLISSDYQQQDHQSAQSIADIITQIQQLMIEKYALSSVPTMSIVTIKPYQDETISFLKNAAEIIMLQPRMMTAQEKQFKVLSYWTKAHYQLIEKKNNIKFLSYQH
jgi:hypothetical protein